MELYWNDDGVVACAVHAPKPGGGVWRNERWRRPSEALSGELSCDACTKERRPRRSRAQAGGRPRAASRSEVPGGGVVVALSVALSCEFCTRPADRVLIDDPEQLPACLPPERIAARLGCGACDDGAWSRVYPVEAKDAAGARARAIARRRAEMRGEDEIPVAAAA